ncbi:MAG: hypothetical protein QHH13_08575 [Melioribacter sp.]|uniref:hypothetical protein n=1 Tax=Rosettibacter primus TaxID=3111523 RepID=UPI00247D8191|nr:hypothetical protein [Melioribacter sp.]
MKIKSLLIILLFSFILIFEDNFAQFIDNFETELKVDSAGLNGWTYRTGDGNATMKFISSKKGYASIFVDATNDKRGIWWALIRRRVSEKMNLSLIKNPKYEFRIEARVRVSDAPKRINLHLNTQRTTDFHSHLMEYDIPDTTNWHTISMTTHNFDARPDDTVYAQLALMDWGFEKYRVDIDYYKVDIVNIDSVGPDLGEPIPYHPPIPDTSTFYYHLPVKEDCIIDLYYSDMNFNNWFTYDENGKKINLLTVSGNQYILLKWDFDKFKNKTAKGSALLELTTFSLQNSTDYKKDFGMIRVTEILDGDSNWNQNNVTLESFCKGKPLNKVLNSQMIIDVEVNKISGGKNYITVSQPVLQRILDGKTKGIAIKPLGAVVASFYSSENLAFGPKLHFNIKE